MPKKPDELVRIYPTPELLGSSGFIPGVPASGADLPAREADGWIASGAATTTPPATPAPSEE